MKKIEILLALLAALIALPAHAEGLSEPVGLRGYNLGMTLSEFKAMPYPDKSIVFDDKPVCSDDKLFSELGAFGTINPVFRKLGVKKCRFYHRYKGSLMSGTLKVGDSRVHRAQSTALLR